MKLRWLSLTLLCLSLFMVYLDTTVTPIALPAMRTHLHMGVAGQQWVVDAYTLAFACLLMSAGSIADNFGRRIVLLGGIAGFTITSAGCALSSSSSELVAARASQGIFAAAVVPVSLAITSTLYADAKARARAVGFWAGAGGVAYAAGPVVGGFLVARFGWPSIFWLNLPIGAACTVLLAILLPKVAKSKEPKSIDILGQILFILGIGGLTFGLIEGNTLGWESAPTLTAFAASAGLICFFIWWESRQDAPMLPPLILRIPTVAVTCAINFFGLFGIFAAIFLLTLYLQNVIHLSSQAAGIRLMALTVALAVAAVVGQSVARRIGTRLTMIIGSALTVAGLAGLELIHPQAGYDAYWWALILLGVGVPLSGGAVAVAALINAVPQELAGTASGAMNTFRQVGAAFGVALAGALLSATGTFDGMHLTFLIAAAGGAVGTAVVIFALADNKTRREPPQNNPATRPTSSAPERSSETAILSVTFGNFVICRCRIALVGSSAGKNDSITSSATVMSRGVPNVATMLKNASCPPWYLIRNGTTRSAGPGISTSGTGWSHG